MPSKLSNVRGDVLRWLEGSSRPYVEILRKQFLQRFPQEQDLERARLRERQGLLAAYDPFVKFCDVELAKLCRIWQGLKAPQWRAWIKNNDYVFRGRLYGGWCITRHNQVVVADRTRQDCVKLLSLMGRAKSLAEKSTEYSV